MHFSELQQIADSSGDPVLLIDITGIIRHLNPPAELLLGANRRGAVCHTLLGGHDSGGFDVCVAGCPVLAMTEHGAAPRSFDMNISTASGQRWVAVSVLTARTETGNISVHILRDSDTRHKLEEATRRFLEQISTLTGHELADLLVFSESPHEQLTAREAEVLELMVQGLTTRAISRELKLSVPTVRNHVQHLLRKLSAHTRLEAVMRAVRDKLVPAPNEAGRK